jgi:uncharacterized membrane protein
VLGFLSLGIFWVCQSTQFTYLEHSDRRLAWWHIAFLLVVGLLPFSTAFLTTHFPLRGAVLVYWANLLLVGAALLGSYRYAQRHSLLRAVDAAVSRALVRRIVLMQVLYAAAAGLCFVSVCRGHAAAGAAQDMSAITCQPPPVSPPQFYLVWAGG